MKKFSAILITALLSISLVGCSGMSNQDSGTLVGGVAGGLIGSQFGGGGGRIAATVLGTVAGAYIGNRVGSSMDATDRLKASQALENNRTNQTTQWHNPDTGNNYSLTPIKTYSKTVRHKKQYCREFIQKAVIANKTQQVYGTACRQPDGTWKVQQKKQ